MFFVSFAYLRSPIVDKLYILIKKKKLLYLYMNKSLFKEQNLNNRMKNF